MPPNNAKNFFGTKVSKAGIPVQNASDKQLIYKDDFSTKTYFDNSDARMLEGLLPDGTYGLWVSVPGIDVTTVDPTLPGQLVFNSNNDTFKIAASGTAIIPLVSTTGASSHIVVTHNLGFIPQIIASSVDPIGGEYQPLPIIALNNASGVVQFQIDVENVTATTFDLWQYNTGASLTPSLSATPVKYYLLQETAN